MNNPLRVAVIGCGRMGRERAQWMPHAGARITRCIDSDPERAAALAAQHPACTAAAELRSEDLDEIDAIFLCTPPGEREATWTHALRTRTPVFVEKPLARDADEIRELAFEAERAELITAVGYMNRARPALAAARQRLKEQPEALIGIVAFWAGGRYRVPWWSKREQSGGAFNEQATHLVDLCRYLGGEVAEVEAFAGEDEERAAVVLRFESGAVGSLVYSCEAQEKVIGLQILTTSGGERYDGWEFAPEMPVPAENPFALEVDAFLRAVTMNDRHAVFCDVADALRTQELVDRIRAAFERRRLAGASL